MKVKHFLIFVAIVSSALLYPKILAGAPARTSAETPQRIISLKPNITELLFAIGAGNQVVGVTKWCDKPEDAKKLPKVADYIKPNIEAIVSLMPDLIVASEENSLQQPIELLRKTGIPILLLPFKNVDDLLKSTLRLAIAAGHAGEGYELVHSMREKILLLTPRSPSPLRLRSGQAPPSPQRGEGDRTLTPSTSLRAGPALSPKGEGVRTLIVVGKRPLIAAGAKTFIGELVGLAGGDNIIDSEILYPKVSIETVIARDPEVIIDLSMGSEDEPQSHPSTKLGASKATRSQVLPEYWRGYEISAVKSGRVYTLDISDFRAGPGLVGQIEKLGDFISPHPRPLPKGERAK